MIDADVEMGGSDQLFNNLVGREFQKEEKPGDPLAGQVVIVTPLLVGTDGVKKMSKSVGNYIGIAEPPEQIYGKTLSIPDSALAQWYELLLGVAPPEGVSARDAKHALARALVERFHGPEAAEAAAAGFERVFVARELPEEIEEWVIAGNGQVHLPEVIAGAFGGSRSEARRAIAGGGVKLDGEPIPPDVLDMPAAELDGRVLQVGKRRFRRLRVA
jgi:tyrosyl-tRNA synthetase